ncbi:MAG: hydroxyacid dehydrogenase [Candidatus Rokubacteria bacterium]|nr:hydroxyacid dehydrogenase [Candidatus Rokubacteria bacterium]
MTGPRPTIVLAVPPHPDARALLERAATVVDCVDLTEGRVVEAAAEAAGLMIRHAPPCSDRLMSACKRLRVVGRYGAGLDTVDLDAATRLGIAVVHAPDANAPAAAEHTLMLMLACVKNLRTLDRMTRAGTWGPARYRGITELRGKTLGLVGVGRIGRAVAALAGAFGMRVLGHDPAVDAAELARRGAQAVEFDTLLDSSDIVSCHTPLTPTTRGLMDRRALSRMPPGAIFVNTSRGAVHDEAALYDALANGRLRAAGLDVWAHEPSPSDNPLFALDNVICTPHVAGVTEEADRAIAVTVATEMLRVLRGERPLVLGNPALWPRLDHLVPATS